MEEQQLIEKILELKQRKNVIILAHNYQIPAIQDLADYTGDSLGLSQEAAKTDADIIVFCGVHFMAETASIVSPDKKVLIPDLEAGCSLAESISVDELIEWKNKHPDAIVISYVNTTAEIKAESDYCCTSSNAVKVVNAVPEDREILFLPDQFLGAYGQSVSGRKLHIWQGACHVHEKIDDKRLEGIKAKYPSAEILIHPECKCSSSYIMKPDQTNLSEKIHIYSTEGMIKHVERSDSMEFVIATEVGILHRLKKSHREKSFHPVNENTVCEYMKMITLEKLYNSILNEEFEVKVPEDIAKRASVPIERMLEIV